MKRLQILIIILLISISAIAQNGINYKALIKDANGNVVANDLIQVQFNILQGVAQTNVYGETHTPTTDANGFIIINIGEGTTNDVFSDINWVTDEHFLNVQIDIGNGFVDLGTKQFMHVPYAKVAENVSGLEALDEGNGMGWRLVGRNSNNYDNIGLNAIDFSLVDDPNLGLGATGNFAFSLGHNGTASGEHAFAFGNQNYSLNDYAITIGNNNSVSGLNSTAIGGINQVTGDYAFAAGLLNVASENYAIALGNGTTASGEYAVAMGRNTTASGESSTALGRNTEATGSNSVAMGSGAEAQGDFSFAFGDESEAQGNNSIAMGDDAFATNDYSIALGRDAFASGESSFASGHNTQASGENATAMGFGTEASGDYSFALGRNTEATGDYSTAFGDSGTALGNFSTAIGSFTIASGGVAFASGRASQASGSFSSAFGFHTRSESISSFAIGSGNIGGGNPLSWVDSDPLFEIGNGSDIQSSNAMTVLKNGNVGIGTNTPQELLHISGGRLRIGTETIEDTGNNRLSFNADLLPDVDNAMQLGNSSFQWRGLWATDGTINTSDRRAKTNIASLNYGLEDVMKLNPISFNWKTNPNDNTKLGLIAQDLLKVIPEVVKTHDWETDENGNKIKIELERMGVYYSDLVPVLIKAIQEQQKIIDDQKLENQQQRLEINELKSLNNRVKQLETLLEIKNN